MNTIDIPDYSTFTETFDALYEQIDEKHKYLVECLRESIPKEAGFGFFSSLKSVIYHIQPKKDQKYPSSKDLFILARDYLCDLYKDGKIKIKLSTPIPLLKNEFGEVIKYGAGDTIIYDNPENVEELKKDLQRRYDILTSDEKSSEALNPVMPSELQMIYCDFSILISYGDRPFYDELQNIG